MSAVGNQSTALRPPPPAHRSALVVRALRKSFADRVVLDGVDLDVAAGEMVALLGANGSGKSTALRCVVGLVQPDSGRIEVVDETHDGHASNAGQGDRRTAMVFQQIHLVRRRSALDNVCAGALARMPLSRSWTPAAFPKEIREHAMACLDRVGMSDRPHDRAGRLSGGQQQRVAIARALCQGASVLLADEPVSALDPAATETVMELLGSLAHDDGIAVAAVLHQPDLARRYADRVLGLLRGRIVLSTPAADLSEGDVRALYASTLEPA